MQEFSFERGIKILDILKKAGLVSSNKEGKRKIDEGAVKILDGEGNELETIGDYFREIEPGEKVLKLGKKMVKIKIQ